MSIGDELVNLTAAAEIVGITVDELRQRHGERLMRKLVTTDKPGAHFRLADILALPAMFEPVDEWSPDNDQHGNSNELVEA